MVYVLLALIALGVWLFCLFDVLTTDEADVRHLPKFAWILIVLLGFWLGVAVWLLFGRPRPDPVTTWSDSTVPHDEEPVLGPDDDPDFLRNLDRQIRGED
jgi:phospholipase D-like protein